MNNIVIFSVTAPPETALKKLSRENIAVYRLKKRGSKLTFGVSEEYIQKVFAIFSHPCYNVSVVKHSFKTRLIFFFKRRFALIIGGVLFVAAAVLSGNSVLKIKVTGNGSYLSPQIVALANECGAREFSVCKNFDAPLLQAKVMALPDVNFCSVRRDGAYLIIDVRTGEEHVGRADYKPLKADTAGEIRRIVAVCGTAERAEGERVAAGDVLIGAYELSESGERTDCLAVGFAEICAAMSISLYFDSESEENAQTALKAPALYSESVLERSYSVSPFNEGVEYKVTFTYLKTVAINME